MFFSRTKPSEKLIPFVQEYWIVENEDPAPTRQKIIPDGFCEIIFHYGDPYRINLGGDWEIQSMMLFAGQIPHHFYLENTGKSGIIGIKLKPASFYHLFGVEMTQFTNKVVDLDTTIPGKLNNIKIKLTGNKLTPEERVQVVDAWLLSILQESANKITKVQLALDMIFEQNGIGDIETIAQKLNCTRRHLEREFKKTVGLTPKLFSRIIRFTYIFQVMKEGDASWVSIALDSGHFDQAHFIKNFKEFTGEEPSQYGFDETNLANFFLKK